MIRYLNEAEVERLLPMADAVALVEQALRAALGARRTCRARARAFPPARCI